ncbi:hypothetical protein D3C78_1756220 [compost metagenome]
MITITNRYDTLVIEGAGNDIPREAAGGRVVAWSAGHVLAEMSPLEAFVKAVADGEFISLETAEMAAAGALAKAEQQREHGHG